jgi:Family of unknown function (DUF6527)
MNRATDISLKGTAQRQPEAAKLLRRAGDVAFVERGVLRSLVIQCPDDCGDVITVNLDPRAGPAWHLYRRRNGAMTLYPSVWRDSGCGAHFILWRDKLLWTDIDNEIAWHDEALRRRILERLPPPGTPAMHFEELAATLGEAPWEVLWECRALARGGFAVASDKNLRFGAAPKRTARHETSDGE